MPTSKSSPPAARGPVSAVQYEPAAGHVLGVELFRASELRRRVPDVEGRGIEQIDFLFLLYVTAGAWQHELRESAESAVLGMSQSGRDIRVHP